MDNINSINRIYKIDNLSKIRDIGRFYGIVFSGRRGNITL